jgi:hypothetical protein
MIGTDFELAGVDLWRIPGVPVWKLWSADPMIAICADRRAHRVRAPSGYFAGPVPVLSRRDQP